MLTKTVRGCRAVTLEAGEVAGLMKQASAARVAMEAALESVDRIAANLIVAQSRERARRSSTKE